MKWSFQTPSLNHFRPVRELVRDLGGLAVGGDHGAGAEEGGLGVGAVVRPLHVEAPLDDVLGVEVGARGVVAVLVDGELHAQLANGVHVPRLAVVQVADLGRRVRQLGLVEQLLVVVDERRVDRERQADGRAVLADLEEVDQRRVELGHVEALGRDERLQVEQVVAEDVEAFDADRADDVRRVAGRDLDLELLRGDAVVVDLRRQVDVLLGGVEVRGELLLGRDLLGLAAAAEADEPADDLAAVGADGRGDGLRGDGDERRRLGRSGGLGGRRRGGRGRARSGRCGRAATGGRQDGDDPCGDHHGPRAGTRTDHPVISSSASSGELLFVGT